MTKMTINASRLQGVIMLRIKIDDTLTIYESKLDKSKKFSYNIIVKNEK